ncbi:CoA transferase [Halovulum dunhuangense]|uniref:CoA transferase n=1 Tax=Halovulum dunhuangense TaxID=1505036 RepID=A0A849KR45_9RHOB|nr:CaiB/BaiF CoA-transferase family protein [Halovulum dunhuangense]NNU79543.1 CoA transferase [Halovulum dunhuangense]
MSGALDGILVIALEQAVAAPYCTAELAAAGARVIKIERAEGDFARGYDRAAKGDSSYFVWLNQGKESIALDIKQEGDLALLNRMLDRADVFVQNLAPGAADRAGLSPEALQARNPGLTCVSISGYGSGPGVDGLKAYDLLVQAESGLSAITGGPQEMGRVGVSICDIGAGMTAHAQVLEALIARGRTGKGRTIEVTLFDVAANWMAVPLIHTEYGSGAPTRQGLRHPSIAPYGAYQSSDGALTLISIQNEREWLRLTQEALDLPELASDPRFKGNAARVENRDALEAALSARIGQIKAEELRARLAAASIAYGAVNTPEDVTRHPALRRRDLTTSGGAVVSGPARAVRGVEGTRPGPAPAIDAQGAAIRKEFAA